MLWVPAEKRVVLIDHNLAFDPQFDQTLFLEVHVFRERAAEIFEDLANRAELAALLEAALGKFDAAMASIPAVWGFSDPECTIPARVEWTTVKRQLAERLPLSRD